MMKKSYKKPKLTTKVKVNPKGAISPHGKKKMNKKRK